MTWFRFTRKGPWHALSVSYSGGRLLDARCGLETQWPSSVLRLSDPPAGEPRCKTCAKRLEAKP